VLFVGYLKKNKGIFELLKIAEKMPSVPFQAVLNCSAEEITNFTLRYRLPENLEFIPQKVDVQSYYQEAFLVLNLSLADACLESFSLSILEGMSCGNPVVVPPVGGHFEYFDSGAGEAIDARNTDQVVEFISRVKDDFALWKQYSDNAVERVEDYSAAAFQRRVERFLSRYLR
jgi:glycosyltransferase involved in cell wall biosynthesis